MPRKFAAKLLTLRTPMLSDAWELEMHSDWLNRGVTITFLAPHFQDIEAGDVVYVRKATAKRWMAVDVKRAVRWRTFWIETSFVAR